MKDSALGKGYNEKQIVGAISLHSDSGGFRIEREFVELLLFLCEGIKLESGLYIIAVPIGNPGDITFRALEALKGADKVLCEDTRITGQLFSQLGVSTPLLTYHEHNADQVRPVVERLLSENKVVALVSDAGTPLISDPGYRLVQMAREKGFALQVLPGPCAAINALVLSGLPTDRFFFEGFLPNKAGQRKKRLEQLQKIPASLIFYESPNRIGEMLSDALEVLGDRSAAVLREMTKTYEEARIGSLSELVQSLNEPKGEIVVVVRSADVVAKTDEELLVLLREKRASLSKKDAVKAVVEETGVAKKRVYELSLKL